MLAQLRHRYPSICSLSLSQILQLLYYKLKFDIFGSYKLCSNELRSSKYGYYNAVIATFVKQTRFRNLVIMNSVLTNTNNLDTSMNHHRLNCF